MKLQKNKELFCAASWRHYGSDCMVRIPSQQNSQVYPYLWIDFPLSELCSVTTASVFTMYFQSLYLKKFLIIPAAKQTSERDSQGAFHLFEPLSNSAV